MFQKALSIAHLASYLLGIRALLAWELLVQIYQIPAFLLPGSSLMLTTLVADRCRRPPLSVSSNML
jgi:ABC-type nitrate/sulfonate/bicarbonate transport system permease component